jgi:lysophospholipase L1-like esterase
MWSKLAAGVRVLAMLALMNVVWFGVATAAGNADFVGVWHLSNGQSLTIRTQDAGGACTGSGVYPMTACQVTGNAYTFTLVTGSYSSVNKGTITGDTIAGGFTDSNGTTQSYTGKRPSTGPTVTDLSVRSGPVKGGTSVVVTGSGFGKPGDADKVVFVPQGGGSPIAAVSPVVVSGTEIDLKTPDMTAAMPATGALHTNLQVSDVNNKASTIGDSGKFNFPLTIVEIGDSIASGEGTQYGYYYDAATGIWGGGNPNATWSGDHPLCHDSPAAYGQVVSDALGANFVQLACTGATYTNGITAPEIAKGAIYQPAQFPGTAYDNAEPDAVVITFGADDVQFVDIVIACIKSALQDPANSVECTAANPGPTIQADFWNYLSSLSASYGTIASNIEARGNAASPKRVPKIIFTNYMNPFPPSGGCPDTWPMTNAQVAYLNTMMGDLNARIKNTVTALAKADTNIGFADISGAIAGHTWCKKDPWDYGLSVITQGGQAASITNASPLSQAPFHPTPAGQAAIADIVGPVVGGMLGLPAVGTITAASSTGSGTGGSTGVTAAPGGSVSATASGYAPDETITIVLHSTPAVLGTVTADSSGDVKVKVTIPPGTLAGSHELLLTGSTSGITLTLPVLVSSSLVSPPPVSPAPVSAPASAPGFPLYWILGFIGLLVVAAIIGVKVVPRLAKK